MLCANHASPCLFLPDGLCLIHSMNGDLLRALEGPELSLRPRLIQSSTEGHCVVYYDKGHFCVFSVNGKMLAQAKGEDQTKVKLSAVLRSTCRPVSHMVLAGRVT